MSNEFDILTENRDYLVAEAGEETYIIEDRGYSEDEGAYLFEIGDSDTVYTDGDFKSTNTVRILESESQRLETYEDVAEKVLGNAGIIELEEENNVMGQGEFGLGGF